jgi:L-rhamnonate dehydratase
MPFRRCTNPTVEREGMGQRAMKISDVEVIVLETPGEYGLSATEDESLGPKHTCIVRVITDAGITGHAQVETQPHVCREIVSAPADASGVFSGLRALALGQDPLQVERLWDRLFRGSFYYGRRGAVLQAISGIDIACWDIFGKAVQLPVSVLLGGRRRELVRAYASTLFRERPDDVRRAAASYVERGFTAVKFGWGPFGGELSFDVALAEAARAGVGDDNELMIDAGWRKRRTAKQAIELVRAVEHTRPYWIEEPCFPEDYETYRRLSEAVETKIAAGEAESTSWSFRQLAEQGSIDVLQPDLSRCGGLTVARRIAHFADDVNVLVCPHAWGSDILTAATLHFTSFLANETFLEFNTSADPVSRELVMSPLEMHDGYVSVPDGPGLGVELNLDVVERLRIS